MSSFWSRLIVLCVFAISGMNLGCSKLLHNLRRDLDDSQMAASGPTIGGRWVERGLLSEEQSRMSRIPASADDQRRGMDYSYSRWDSPGNVSGSAAGGYVGNMQGGAPADAYGQQSVSFSNTPNLSPPIMRQYKNGDRATRADFVDDQIDDGSLWASDGQTNYYFTKNKIHAVGDIVTVNVQSDFYRDAITEVTRTLTPREREIELAEAQERIRRRYLGLDAQAGGIQEDGVTTTAAAAQRAPAEGDQSAPKEIDENDIPKATYADIDITSHLEFKEGDVIMSEVVQRYPNGNYKIRGTKRLRYRNQIRYLTLLAIVRGSDISEQSVIDSEKLYEYRLEVVR